MRLKNTPKSKNFAVRPPDPILLNDMVNADRMVRIVPLKQDPNAIGAATGAMMDEIRANRGLGLQAPINPWLAAMIGSVRR